MNNTKAKKKNRRVKSRTKEKTINRKFKLIGVNSAGLSSKLHSFDKILQETKMKVIGKIKTENAKNYQIFELVRKSSCGGGLAIGVLNDLTPVWLG